MTRQIRQASRLLACAFAAFCLSAGAAAAQSWLNNLTNPAGPPPADNAQVAMALGRQVAGYGGKCIHVEGEMRSGSLLVMRDCDPNSVNQRFKFENGNFKTSLRMVSPTGWVPMCVASVAQERLALQPCSGIGITGAIGANPITQQWAINGREIRRADGAFCLDVYKSQTSNGTPVIYFKCNGDGNQQWGWR